MVEEAASTFQSPLLLLVCFFHVLMANSGCLPWQVGPPVSLSALFRAEDVTLLFFFPGRI